MTTIEVGDIVTAGNDVYVKDELYARKGERGLVRKVVDRPEGRGVLVKFNNSRLIAEMSEDKVTFISSRACPICKEGDPFHTSGYMLNDKVWYQVMPTHKGWPHLACFEKRLGRPLREEDFEDVPLNRMLFLGIKIGRRAAKEVSDV
jgi:hypothetical protein